MPATVRSGERESGGVVQWCARDAGRSARVKLKNAAGARPLTTERRPVQP